MIYKVTNKIMHASYHDVISYKHWRDVNEWILQLNDPLVFLESRRGCPGIYVPKIIASGPGETMLLLKYGFMLVQVL